MKTKDNKTTVNKLNKKEVKTKNMLIVSVILSIIILAIVICTVAFSKFTKTASGSATAQIAAIRCSVQVTGFSGSSNSGNGEPEEDEVVNPYCLITVRNYETVGEGASAVDKRTETDVKYKLNISIREGYEYYLQDVQATNGANSVPGKNSTVTPQVNARNQLIEGTFGHEDVETTTFTIVFLNSGNVDVSELVTVELVATQN